MPINLSAWNNAGRQCETLRFQVKTIAIESTCFSASNCLIQVSCKIVHWTPSAVKLFLWWTALKLVCVYLCVYIYQGEIENNEEFKILQGKFRQEKLMSAREGPTGVHDLWMDGGGGGSATGFSESFPLLVTKLSLHTYCHDEFSQKIRSHPYGWHIPVPSKGTGFLQGADNLIRNLKDRCSNENVRNLWFWIEIQLSQVIFK